MTAPPIVSIVMPLFDDEGTVAAALRSCLAQTLAEIEVICVDDASTDGTAEVVESFCARDARVSLIRHEQNLSAFQARRTGILAARADHVLFLDGDDELEPKAAATALAHAQRTGADLVGFGVTVVENDGSTGTAYERKLQPVHRSLEGAEVLRGLFPIDKPAQGQLWRYLFRTAVLRNAHELLPRELVLPRVNDLPLMFLVASLATSYASITDRLYRYHFGRGGSGQRIEHVERAQFYTSAIDSIDAIRPAVEQLATGRAGGEMLTAAYESARLSIVGYVCFQLIRMSHSGVLDAALAQLHTVAPAHDIIHATARFYPVALKTLKFHTPWQPLAPREASSILLTTSSLRTGGVSMVLTTQARYLRDAGYRVTIAARGPDSDRTAVPDGVAFVELTGRSLTERLQNWGAICREHAVDLVIDHQVLYATHWPEFALMARAEGAATIGWVHNFFARPIFDGSDKLERIERCANTLAHLVVLSPLDVAYFKLRGIAHTSFVPNPPSPLLRESTAPAPKAAPSGRIELVWWGRLEPRTKQVAELVEVAVQLRRLEVDFGLTVIGPGWDDMTPKKLNALARRRGVGDAVRAIGPLHGQRLLDAIDRADAFLSTSIIEGYQLTIAEAQARGLPVFMYELPWLTLVHNNEGIVSVPQGDARSLADQIANVRSDPERYTRLSQASLVAAQRAIDVDVDALYRGVVTDTLPARFSPEPTLNDAQRLLGLVTFFADRSPQKNRSRAADASSPAARAWQTAAPIGRGVLRRLPGLRPLAHRAKQFLRAS
ncbi:MAG: glycosyltransferase [Microbacterium sp.]